MFTLEDEPWVLYLEIDEETLESKLRDDTPADIREKYEKYLKEQRDNPHLKRAK